MIKQDEKLGRFIAVVAYRQHLPQIWGGTALLASPGYAYGGSQPFCENLLKGDKFRLTTLLESRSREILTQVNRHVLFYSRTKFFTQNIRGIIERCFADEKLAVVYSNGIEEHSIGSASLQISNICSVVCRQKTGR